MQIPANVNQRSGEAKAVRTTDSASQPIDASKKEKPFCRQKNPQRTNQTKRSSQRMTSIEVGTVIQFKGHPQIPDEAKAEVYYINTKSLQAGVLIFQTGTEMHLSGVPRKTIKGVPLVITDIEFLKIASDVGPSTRPTSQKALRHSEGQAKYQTKDSDNRESTEALRNTKVQHDHGVLGIPKTSERTRQSPRLSAEYKELFEQQNAMRQASGDDLPFGNLASDTPIGYKGIQKKTMIPKCVTETISKKSKDSGLAVTRESSRSNVCHVPGQGTRFDSRRKSGKCFGSGPIN